MYFYGKNQAQKAGNVRETFEESIISRKAKGLTDKTITTYNQHFNAISKHLPVEKRISKLQKSDLDDMIASMRDAGLSPNSINSFTRTLKSFFS